MSKLVILDAGHGCDTAGKCSPDKRLLEYQWARDVVQRIAAKLNSVGVRVHILVPENTDIPLYLRTQRANLLSKQHGSKNCLLVSVHLNAAGNDSKWHNATGFSSWVAPNASNNSKRLAQLLFDEADFVGLKGNRCVPACRYWVGNYAIVRDTHCPAVLTENLFMDNKFECDYLLSEVGKNALVEVHVFAILNYLKQTA